MSKCYKVAFQVTRVPAPVERSVPATRFVTDRQSPTSFVRRLLEHGAEILQKTDALAATSRSPPKWLESRHANLLMRLTLQAGHEAGGESWKPSPTVAMAATTASVS